MPRLLYHRAGSSSSDQSNSSINRRVPFLSEIPVVKSLFKFDSHSTRRTELLIILTPHVINDVRTAREITDKILRESGIPNIKDPDEIQKRLLEPFDPSKRPPLPPPADPKKIGDAKPGDE